MPKTKQRPSAATIISKDALDQAGVRLQELPDKPKEFWSLREAVAILQDEITIALNRGYTYDEVVKLLANKDISITASSLKRYLATARRERDGGSRTRRTRKSTARTSEVNESTAPTPTKRARKPATRSVAKATPVSKSRTTVDKKPLASTTGRRKRSSATQ